jgi:cytochrome c oxidase cbb3-type subunit I/II
MEDPRSTTPQSIMPAYPWLLTEDIDFAAIPVSVRAMRAIGVPYSEGDLDGAVTAAETQAREIMAEVVEQGGPEGLADKKIAALIAYLQRLGTDISRPVESEAPEETEAAGDATSTSMKTD